MVSGEFGERRWCWSGGVLHVVHWGEETVAFYEATASTHVFDEDTARLVKVLRQGDGGMTSAVLWNTAYGDVPLVSDYQALDATLEALLQAGLVTATTT